MAKNEKNYSRRDFLKTSGIAAGALIGGGVIGGLIGANVNDGASPAQAPATGEGGRPSPTTS